MNTLPLNSRPSSWCTALALALACACLMCAPSWASGSPMVSGPAGGAANACGCPAREQVIAQWQAEQALAAQARARETALQGEGYGTVRPELEDGSLRRVVTIVHPSVVVPPMAQGRPYTPESRGAAARLGIAPPEQDLPLRGARRVIVSPSN